VEDPVARVFYELEAIKGTWTKRELKRQIDTNYYIRSGISHNPEKMSRYVQSNAEKTDLEDIIKTPYVYEFLGLSDKEIVKESDLEEAVIEHLEEFMMELGTGFCFETRQKRILVDDEYFYCDLVFYNRILKCHVLIDLKAEKLSYSDVAQMNLYLSYYKHNIMQSDDNPPVGILMCTEAGKELVKYTTDGIDDNLLIQKYWLSLPKESLLTDWLKKEVAKYGGKLKKLSNPTP
jgi:predicted nuclease of restriction endonuclease-like (RecB) superfamily